MSTLGTKRPKRISRNSKLFRHLWLKNDMIDFCFRWYINWKQSNFPVQKCVLETAKRILHFNNFNKNREPAHSTSKVQSPEAVQFICFNKTPSLQMYPFMHDINTFTPNFVSTCALAAVYFWLFWVKLFVGSPQLITKRK